MELRNSPLSSRMLTFLETSCLKSNKPEPEKKPKKERKPRVKKPDPADTDGANGHRAGPDDRWADGLRIEPVIDLKSLELELTSDSLRRNSSEQTLDPPLLFAPRPGSPAQPDLVLISRRLPEFFNF